MELENLINATKLAYDALSDFIQADRDYEDATDNLILTDEEFNAIVHTRRILSKYYRQLSKLTNQ